MHLKRFSSELKAEANAIDIDSIIQNREIVGGYTVDNYNSLDLDDAILLERKGENYLAIVTIADISESIKINSNLYNEAFQRVETIYRKAFNIPMLPRSLSEAKLSLNMEGIKPSITFYVETDKLGNILNTEIKETAFKSSGRITYELFDKIKDDSSDSRSELFQEMTNFATILLEMRRQKGALAIYDLKQGLMSNEEGVIIHLDKSCSYNSYIVVQEFMILTNKAIARFAAENNIPLLYRNHNVKSLAPGRADIIGQINNALINHNYLGALIDKIKFWFQKANYGPILEGHYGLNEPAYTHVTSPIRRFADLINHILIKNYLHNKAQDFDTDKLLEISKHINDIVILHKENESEFFKERVISSGNQKINNMDLKEIYKLEEYEFINVLRASAINENCNDNVKHTIFRKTIEKNLSFKAIYVILAKAPNTGNWREVKINTLKFVYSQSGYAFSLVNVLLQKGIISSFNFEERGVNNSFLCVGVGIVNDKIIRSKDSIGTRKKDAQHLAASDFLRNYLELPIEEFIEFNLNAENIENSASFENSNMELSELEFEPIRQGNQIPPGYSSSINYVGQLVEYCQTHKNVPEANYIFSKTGADHLPVITCKASVIIEGQLFESEASAGNNKASKQVAAYIILTQLEEVFNKPDLVIKAENSDNINKSNLDINYIGLLNEYCTKHNLPIPEFYFKQIGEAHQSVFQCNFDFLIDGKTVKFEGLASSKKEAKKKAAENCVDFLKL
jgi:ribonuclease R